MFIQVREKEGHEFLLNFDYVVKIDMVWKENGLLGDGTIIKMADGHKYEVVDSYSYLISQIKSHRR